MITTILRALVLSADVNPKIIFIPGFILAFRLSKRHSLGCFGVLPGSEFAD